MSETIHLKGSYEATEAYSLDPLVGVRNNVLSPIECAYLIELAKPHVKRAGVVLDEGYKASEGRTGSNHWLKYDEDDVVQSIGKRIADIVGLPLANAESMQIIHYGPEQEYRPHFDAFNLSLPRGQRAAKWGGQRLVTALVYLNNVQAGGATQFPKLGITVPATPGRMVIFHNTTHDISGPHPLSLHAGMPVEAGEKWAFNMWFRLQDTTDEFVPGEVLPTVAIGQSVDIPHGPQVSDNPSAPVKPERLNTSNTSSTSGAADTASATGGLTVRANRADALWQRAVSRTQNSAQDLPDLHVSYWDTYGNKTQPEPPENWPGATFRTASREVLNPLSDIAFVASSLASSGHSQLIPTTFTTSAAAIAVGPKADDLWFIRSKLRTARNKTLCLPTPVMMAATVPSDRVIQKAVDRLALIDQHKFTARLYLAIIGNQLFCADESVLFVHGASYAPNDPNFASQVDNLSYRETGSSIRVIAGGQSPFAKTLITAGRTLAAELEGLLADVITDCADGAFALLALDTLLTQANELKLLRIHTFPNFMINADIDAAVHVPLFEDVLRVMAGSAPSQLSLITN
ncbi:2OG-Fe(II) oxygenase [Candidatus Paraluminiphilus aquimaris]|uniref:2OG-Fe(II) oxygenase n=1 Tax=Candidatus Paraluminiphilus aquimaris TaxID=2518994 RepID=A0ABY6QAJ2_9GAMM|nr:2OG-Fe(II) oxygenase [Candidatus Paraluminiphilus aquimaris]UZP75403.1 2OG-Fe(II) oxygenase [Candidatus Paraluminiphilus aquimaris]